MLVIMIAAIVMLSITTVSVTLRMLAVTICNRASGASAAGEQAILIILIIIISIITIMTIIIIICRLCIAAGQLKTEGSAAAAAN